MKILEASDEGTTTTTTYVASGDCDTCATENCDGVIDECGVCNGPGIPEGYCDCIGHVADCLG